MSFLFGFFLFFYKYCIRVAVCATDLFSLSDNNNNNKKSTGYLILVFVFGFWFWSCAARPSARPLSSTTPPRAPTDKTTQTSIYLAGWLGGGGGDGGKTRLDIFLCVTRSQVHHSSSSTYRDTILCCGVWCPVLLMNARTF